MQFKSKNLNKVRLVAWLLYAIFEILLKVVFWIWSCNGRGKIFLLGWIWFNQYSTYSRLQHKIPNPVTQWDNPIYKHWGWDVIDWKKSAGYRHENDRLFRFGKESFRDLTYLMDNLFFFLKLTLRWFYSHIETSE